QIPFVIAGMNNLFATAEAEAARQLFYFLADRPGVSARTLETHWLAALPNHPVSDLRRAIASTEETKRAMAASKETRFQVYNLQRQFLRFLEDAGVLEDRLPRNRAEVIYYNLGKFSQIISDFESIHYKSKPMEKFRSFADFLEHRAEDAYPEGWQDNQ